MNRDDAQRVLENIAVLRHRCDLDLLVFFARHPHALLTSEQLTIWLGYDAKQIAESLELLLEAGLLSRAQNPTHAARMYILAVTETSNPWRPSLLKLASSREGRLALLDELARRSPRDKRGPVARSARQPTGAHRLRAFVVHRTPRGAPTTKAG